jgi:hypothetical protein
MHGWCVKSTIQLARRKVLPHQLPRQTLSLLMPWKYDHATANNHRILQCCFISFQAHSEQRNLTFILFVHVLSINFVHLLVCSCSILRVRVPLSKTTIQRRLVAMIERWLSWWLEWRVCVCVCVYIYIYIYIYRSRWSNVDMGHENRF